VVRVTYWPQSGQPGDGRRCGNGPLSSVEDVVGADFIVFVNLSATVGHGQLTSYVGDSMPLSFSRRAMATVVAHACERCSTLFTPCNACLCVSGVTGKRLELSAAKLVQM